jgi:hypothetical protein
MFRDVDMTGVLFTPPESHGLDIHAKKRCCAALTPTALRLKCSRVPPLKGGTFRFDRVIVSIRVIDATAPMRAS